MRARTPASSASPTQRSCSAASMRWGTDPAVASPWIRKGRSGCAAPALNTPSRSALVPGQRRGEHGVHERVRVLAAELVGARTRREDGDRYVGVAAGRPVEHELLVATL